MTVVSEAPAVERLLALLAKFGTVVHGGAIVAAGNRDAVRTALGQLSRVELLKLTGELREAGDEVAALVAGGPSSGKFRDAILRAADLADDLRAALEECEPEDVEEVAAEIVERVRAGDEVADEPNSEDEGTTDDEAPEGIAAAISPVTRTKPRVPARHRPQPAVARSSLGLIAAGDLGTTPAGSEFGDLADVAQALHEKARRMRSGIGGDGEQVSVAVRNYGDEYPEERRLDDRTSATGTSEKIMAALGPRESLVAAGGLCAPLDVRRELVGHGVDRRPLRDSLPSFLAVHGGITYNDSPVLSDIVVDNTGGAIDTITLDDDAGGATKTVQEITCGTAREAEVQAITLQLKHGSLADKYNPERMREWMRLGLVAHARHAEDELFTAMIAARTRHYTNTVAEFGAYRDLKRHVLGTVEELRDLHRDDNLPLHVQMPGYVAAMLATDLIAQAPGDSTYQVTAATIRADMQTWATGVTVTFLMDGTAGRLLSTPANGARSPGFDADVDWLIYPEGDVIFLDGGSLDLGIVRDSTLVAQNRFIPFSETMEGIARVGNTLYHVTSSLCAGGDSQVPTDVAACQPQGS